MSDVESFHDVVEDEVHFNEDVPRVENPTPPTPITSNDMDVIIKGWEMTFEQISRCLREVQRASENTPRSSENTMMLGTRASEITTTLEICATTTSTTLEITTTLEICATTIGAGITDPTNGLHMRMLEGIAVTCSETHTIVG